MADREVPGERGEVALVEDLRDQAHVLVDEDPAAVADRDAGRLLAAVLEGVEAEVGELGDLLAGRPDPEDAAGVLRALLAGEQIVREPSVAARHAVSLRDPVGPPTRADRRRRGHDPRVDDAEVTYASYLRIPELLDLQTLRSDPPHPEELHFIVTHQAIELWFKLVLHDLTRVVAAVDRDEWTAAVVLLRRVNDVVDSVMRQLRVLQDMPPWAFHEFRSYLGTASGTQSVQFREIEVLSGLRDEDYLTTLTALHAAELPEAVRLRLDAPSLADAHRSAAARLGIADGRRGTRGLLRRDRPRPPFYALCEALLDYDERFLRLRFEHLVLVERALGARARGTGGTAITYLQRTTRYRFFPELWELRNALSVRGGGELAR